MSVIIIQQLSDEEADLLDRLASGRAQPDGSRAFDRLFSEELVTRNGQLTKWGKSVLSTRHC